LKDQGNEGATALRARLSVIQGYAILDENHEQGEQNPKTGFRHRRRAFRPVACSGGGNSSPLSFSTFGGRCFPAGPSLEPGEIRIAERLRFT
jgi:hypothetical protein